MQVPIERAGELRNGLPIRILSPEGAGTLATTSDLFISPRVDDQTQSMLVKGAIRNPDGRLRSSQFVRARVVWKTTEGLAIPVTAVVRINGQYFAFVAEEAEGPNGKSGARREAARHQSRPDHRRQLFGAWRHCGRRAHCRLRRAEAGRWRADCADAGDQSDFLIRNS